MSTLGKFNVHKTLGSGAFSKVKLGQHQETGEPAALKIMKRDENISDAFMQLVINEVKTMRELDHPNLVKLLDFSDSDQFKKESGEVKDVFYMALELCSGGELFDFIAQTGRFTEPVARYYFKQMIEGLDYMHAKGVSHRDIKPENVLLNDEFVLKIADFGFASCKASNETRRGTESYMAPEIHQSQTYSGASVDLFAAAIILFIMITQHPPFAKAIPTDPHYKLVCANRLDLFWKFHSRSKPNGMEFFSEEFISLISSMLQLNPTHRPSMTEIKCHPWFNGPTATEQEIAEEFATRKATLDGFSQTEAAVPTAQPDPNIFDQHRAHRGEGDGEMETKLPVLQRTAKNYFKQAARVTQFFSTSSPDDLFNTLVCYADSNTNDYKLSDKNYKCKMSILKEDSKVSLVVNLLKVDEGKHCIEF